MTELQDKVALVVGAGSVTDGLGNGRATAITFAREGATTICADRDLAAAEQTASTIRDEGGAATALHLDVTDPQQVQEVVAAVRAEHGRIDVLDNNVGIAAVGGVVDLDPDEWDRVFRVNVTGAFTTMRHVIPVMVDQGGGSIVNISSVASIRWSGVPYAAYYASKAALNHLTRTTAVEYARQGVRVNAVLPGLIRTPMVTQVAGLAGKYASTGDVEDMMRARDRQVPMGHMGDAWDIANAALYLASDRAKYVTGVELVVDGGLTVGFASPSA